MNYFSKVGLTLEFEIFSKYLCMWPLCNAKLCPAEKISPEVAKCGKEK